jgi:hypothetical protein
MKTSCEDFEGLIAPYREQAAQAVREYGIEAFRRLREEPLGSANVDALAEAYVFAFIESVLGTLQDPFDDVAFLGNSSVKGYLEANFSGMPAAEVGAAKLQHLYLSWQRACHKRVGRRSYEISPGLAELLLQTELRGLHGADLRLPFESVLLQVPVSLGLEMEVQASVGGSSLVREILLTQSLGVGSKRWVLTAVGPGDVLSAQNFSLLLSLPDEVPVDDSLDDLARWLANRKQVVSRNWRDLFRWAMNVVVYATCGNADVVSDFISNKEARHLWERIQKLSKHSSKRERLRAEWKRLDPQRRIVLGRGVIAPRPSVEARGESGTGQLLTVQVRVQGHWKHQPHGPGNKQRKLLWIQPYWRGPEDGPVRNTPHRLK